jgi:hypothetical protein
VCGVRTARARDWEWDEGKDRTVVFMKVRFKVLKAVFLKIQVVWGVVLCRPVWRH